MDILYPNLQVLKSAIRSFLIPIIYLLKFRHLLDYALSPQLQDLYQRLGTDFNNWT